MHTFIFICTEDEASPSVPSSRAFWWKDISKRHSYGLISGIYENSCIIIQLSKDDCFILKEREYLRFSLIKNWYEWRICSFCSEAIRNSAKFCLVAEETFKSRTNSPQFDCVSLVIVSEVHFDSSTYKRLSTWRTTLGCYVGWIFLI